MDNTRVLLSWFEIWKNGNYLDLPLHEDFSHTSPYGTINGKKNYLKIVADNESLFLGNQLIIHDIIESENKGCVRYTMRSPTSEMEVSEWFYVEDGLIKKIVAYYDKSEELKNERGLEV